MHTVYVIWSDNGEEWEDHYECPLYAFPTEEMAERYLDKNFEVKIETPTWGRRSRYTWSHKPVSCERYDDCHDCPIYRNRTDSESGHVECDTYHKIMSDSWDNTTWFYSGLTLYDSAEEAMNDENAYL